MVEIFKALAEESRLRILAILMEGEMCVCEIESCLKMTQSNVSRHLTALKNSGIVESYKKAQWAYYKVSEKFKENNQDLWIYLEKNLKKMPNYHKDFDECQNFKGIGLCDVKKL